MLLSEYILDLREAINDPNIRYYTPTQATRWINRGRKRTAARAQCIRRMPPASGTVTLVTVTNGGSGYTTVPAVQFSGPQTFDGVAAQGTATILAGLVIGVTVTNPGSGYVAAPTIQFIGGGGTGATATAGLTTFFATQPGKEIYPFSDINALFPVHAPGVGAVIGIQSLSISWGGSKPTLDYYPFTAFQAYCRSIPVVVTGRACAWTQYGQGEEGGSFYIWPKPNTAMSIEADCYCTPIPLVSDATPDALPYPWNESVRLLAASYAFEKSQRFDDSARMKRLWEMQMPQDRAMVTPTRLPSLYRG